VGAELIKYETGTLCAEWNAAIEMDCSTLQKNRRVCDTKRKKTERKIALCNVYMVCSITQYVYGAMPLAHDAIFDRSFFISRAPCGMNYSSWKMK
jgi:hypothetical protein